MNKILRACGVLAAGTLLYSLIFSCTVKMTNSHMRTDYASSNSRCVVVEIKEETTVQPAFTAAESIVVEQSSTVVTVSDEEIYLLALVTMAEAEGECEEGKRLVIDTILNRVDSEHFPDTITDVIYQPNQFTSMWNGRSDRCEVTDEICELVREELAERTNSEVIFFRTGRYSDYGEPMFVVENHYFSSYE